MWSVTVNTASGNTLDVIYDTDEQAARVVFVSSKGEVGSGVVLERSQLLALARTLADWEAIGLLCLEDHSTKPHRECDGATVRARGNANAADAAQLARGRR